jgi:predicted transcriptional regulator
MQTAKDSAKHLIEQLPDSATLNDIMYELYVKQKIERGMQASREGRVTPHTEVKKRYLQRAAQLKP